ncbi:MAG: hypothetical protein JWN89_90 [Parcubacteria group bacterium]|nr:hypothetical protein [Parcubacteria group bacterium]
MKLKNKKLAASRIFNGILLLLLTLALGTYVLAATPNPGHPWAEVGNGDFQVTGATAMRTYTVPDASATLLTTNALVTSAQGGTGNGFTKFSGPTTAEKTFTLPDASATVLTSSAAVTLAQGGTNAAITAVNGGIAYSTASALALSAAGSAGQILQSGGAAVPTWSTATYPATAGTAGNHLVSNGTNFVSAAQMPAFYVGQGVAPTAASVTTNVTNVTYFIYLGKATKAFTSCNAAYRVTTVPAGTLTWAEIGIAKGTPALNAASAMTRLGFADVSGVVTSAVVKKTAITVSSVTIGDDLWFAWGGQYVTTQWQGRATLQDDIQSGVVQQFAGRFSTMGAAAASTLSANTLLPLEVAVSCT